jgi:hypothetical protein
MQIVNLRNLLHLLRRTLTGTAGLLACLAFFSGACSAQGFMNTGKYDQRPYYFGISLAYNSAFYKMKYDPSFIQNDSLLVVQPLHSSGFSLGLLGNLALNKRFDLRLNPMLVFAEKDLHYVFKEDSAAQNKNVESVLLSVPLQLKFKSDRIGNFRMYLFVGGKFDYDLAANVHARKADDLVQLSPFDLGYEAGFGFEFYLPYFIFSPEIKISNGTRDIHLRQPGNIYSDRIGEMLSRMVVFTIHLEG